MPYLFKNVIITCEGEHYLPSFYRKACVSIKKLVEANAVLDTITLVTVPQKVGISHTAGGKELNAISFADFLYAQGAFMTELKMVQCKFFNVIMKKACTVEVETVGDGTLDNDTIIEETFVRRLLISFDLRYLHPAATEEGPLANEETIKYARSKADAVENELMGLKERFEEVFEDDEKAVEEGKCRLLDENETTHNGMALSLRK